MIRFLVNLPEELRNVLKDIAKTRGQTLNGLIRQVLREWANKNQKTA